MPHRPTLSDIAQLAQVSISTVSRALRGDFRISEAVRRQVQEVADALGYRPDPLVSAVAARRWHTPSESGANVLAFVQVRPPADPVSREPVGENPMILEGARRRAAELGYRVDVFRLGSPSEAPHVGRVLLARGVRGVVLAPLYDVASLDLPWERLEAVCCGVPHGRPRIHHVAVDHFAQMQVAIGVLESRGYRRIGLLHFRHGFALEDDDRRLGAYWAHTTSPQRTAVLLPPLEHQYGPALPARARAWWFENRPDAVIGFSCGEFFALRDGPDGSAPLRCPEDFAFLALHHAVQQPFVSGLESPASASGSAAVDLVDALLRRPDRHRPSDALVHLLAPRLVEGQTLGRAGAAALDAGPVRAAG